MLFQEQLSGSDTAAGFLPLPVLEQRFAQNPDPTLAAFGGTRVDLAIAVERTVYQLQVAQDPATGAVAIAWARADTVNRKVKEAQTCAQLQDVVPTTLAAAVESMCQAFGLDPQAVWKDGVDLLSFWEGVQANDKLELPLSRDWKRYSLRNARPSAAA